MFEYRDARGRLIRDAATLARIRSLVIPPAWQQVWICPDPRGHIQATGRDARGRKQYRYHPRWREERDSTKYDRLIAFARALPGVRRQVSADLRREGLPREKVVATIVRLLETTFMRVGNEEYARTNHSFGLTTLQDRHVDFGGGTVHFHFRGKSGVFHRINVHDARLARIVRRCRELPGQELFQYLDDDGGRHSVTSSDVNAYLRAAAGGEFTAKDFRTWAGTVLAAQVLRTAQLAGRAPTARTVAAVARKPTNRDVTRAIAEVAERLGNTVAVCRKCYVHPHVITAFLEGALHEHLPLPALRVVDGGVLRAGLRPEESAVLRLLLRYRATTRAGRHSAARAA